MRTELYKGESHFRKGLSIYVNRVEETFAASFHNHDFIEITYVREGKGFHHIGDQIVPVRKGELFVIPIGIPHVFRPVSASGKDKLIVSNCIFTEQALQAVAALTGDFPLIEALKLGPEDKAGYGLLDRELAFEPIFQSMLEEFGGDKPGNGAALQSLLGWLLILRRRKRQQPEEGRLPAEDPIDDTLAYIRRHVSEDLRAQALAERCRLSERHFVRLFRKRTGQNPHPFVQQVRMRTACEYLSGTTLTIAAIAEAVGYRDLPSFYRVFRQVVGTTPREYKLKPSLEPVKGRV